MQPAIETGAGRRPLFSVALLLSSLLVLAVSVSTQPSVAVVAASVALLIPFVYAHRWLLEWRRLVALVVLVVLFIPIKRYGLPGNMPFDLEPYRLVLALVLIGWFVSLLIDPRVRARAAGVEAPILVIAIASVLSDTANSQRINQLQVNSEVVKGLMFLASFFALFYFIVSVVRTRQQVERLVEVLCLGGAVVGVLARSSTARISMRSTTSAL